MSYKNSEIDDIVQSIQEGRSLEEVRKKYPRLTDHTYQKYARSLNSQPVKHTPFEKFLRITPILALLITLFSIGIAHIYAIRQTDFECHYYFVRLENYPFFVLNDLDDYPSFALNQTKPFFESEQYLIVDKVANHLTYPSDYNDLELIAKNYLTWNQVTEVDEITAISNGYWSSEYYIMYVVICDIGKIPAKDLMLTTRITEGDEQKEFVVPLRPLSHPVGVKIPIGLFYENDEGEKIFAEYQIAPISIRYRSNLPLSTATFQFREMATITEYMHIGRGG